MSSKEEKNRTERLERFIEFDRLETAGIRGWVAGIDEAGRGPLAGPVVAAAVILEQPETLAGIDDSKKLAASRREELFLRLTRAALVGIGVVDEKMIDKINIYEASRLAMKKAVMALPHTPSFLLLDGPMKLDLPIPQKGIIRGDQKSVCVAAASIIAKVFRDRLMHKIHELYPAYAFFRHKGYGTAQHLEILQAIGPCPAHRRSFSPVREVSSEAATEALT